MKDILYIVVPCYNEEEVLPETSRRLRAKLKDMMTAGTISERSRILFVNDGSRDKTWEIISSLYAADSIFYGVDRMVEEYYAGCDIVYGVRSSRKKDTFFKRFTAEGFYRVMNLLGAETVFNHADYRLMSKRALEGLAEFKEVNLFLRGMVPMIGYRTETVEYEESDLLERASTP